MTLYYTNSKDALNCTFLKPIEEIFERVGQNKSYGPNNLELEIINIIELSSMEKSILGLDFQ
jgi:hypothetical protein